MDPPRLVRRDPASGYDAMHVRVMQEILPPGVQNAEEADGGAEMFGIGGDHSAVGCAVTLKCTIRLRS